MTDHFIPLNELIMSVAVFFETVMVFLIELFVVVLFIYIIVKIIEMIELAIIRGVVRYYRVIPPVDPEITSTSSEQNPELV